MVSDRVVQRGREHPSKKVRKTALDFQGQTASPDAVRSSPEIFLSREPPLLTQAGAAPSAAMAWRISVLPGSKNRAQGHEGRSGT